MGEDLYDRILRYMNEVYPGRFHRNTIVLPGPSIPLLRRAYFHKFVIKDGRRYTSALMNTTVRNSLVRAQVAASFPFSWVGEIMNIFTIHQKFGRESFVQIRWMKSLPVTLFPPDSI